MIRLYQGDNTDQNASRERNTTIQNKINEQNDDKNNIKEIKGW